MADCSLAALAESSLLPPREAVGARVEPPVGAFEEEGVHRALALDEVQLAPQHLPVELGAPTDLARARMSASSCVSSPSRCSSSLEAPTTPTHAMPCAESCSSPSVSTVRTPPRRRWPISCSVRLESSACE